MAGLRIVLAALLGSSALCPLRADAADSHDLIIRCAETAAAHARGLAAARSVCPGIDQAAASLRMGTLLPPDWDKRATPTTLVDLDALAERYSGHPPSILPAAAGLRAVAQRLQQPGPLRSSTSVWEQVKAWVHRQFAPAARLLKWLRPQSGWTAGPGVRAMLLIGTSVLLLLAIGAFIMAELRAAGLLGTGQGGRTDTRRRRAGAHGTRTEEEVGTGDSTLALDRPALALQMLIEALRRSRRIEKDTNLTCREVGARAVFDTQGQREAFTRIALLAERSLYGPHGAALRLPNELRPALQALRTQLSAAPATRSAAS